jgi:hypothetical protein
LRGSGLLRGGEHGNAVRRLATAKQASPLLGGTVLVGTVWAGSRQARPVLASTRLAGTGLARARTVLAGAQGGIARLEPATCLR